MTSQTVGPVSSPSWGAPRNPVIAPRPGQANVAPRDRRREPGKAGQPFTWSGRRSGRSEVAAGAALFVVWTLLWSFFTLAVMKPAASLHARGMHAVEPARPGDLGTAPVEPWRVTRGE